MEEYDLSIDLFERFNMNVYDVAPCKDMFTLYTDKGTKMLKKIDYDICELEFINQALNYVKKKFNRVPNFEKDLKGDIYTIFNEKIYCILNTKEGSKCKLNSFKDLETTVESLAEFHMASKGFKSNVSCRNNYNNMVSRIRKKREELKLFKKIIKVKDSKNELEKIYDDNIDYIIYKIDEGIKVLNGSFYKELCSDIGKIAICGNQHFYSDIVIEENKAYFNNFDNFNLNLRVYDLCSLINKLIKYDNFNLDLLEKVVSRYDSLCKLDYRETEVLYGMLFFPYDFYSIFKEYFLGTKNIEYSNLLLKAKNSIKYMNSRKKLLNKMRL